MNSRYPSEYEDIFQLILNLVEEVKRGNDAGKRISVADLENYFHRMTAGSLGEYEFMRRMAFYGHPVIRIAALPILWNDYSQPVSPDFIVNFGDSKICVEVKNYKWDNHLKGFVVPKRSIDNCIRFKSFFKYDRACLAVKRFERWYMFDLERIEKKEYSSSYLIEYDEMSRADMLGEPGVIFQLWTPPRQQKAALRYADCPPGFKNEGVIYSDIQPDEAQDYIRLRFCFGNGHEYPTEDNCEIRQYRSTQMDIVNIVYQTIKTNLKEVYSCGYDWQSAVKMNIDDVIPSTFSIHDRLRGEVTADELQGDINTLASSGIIFNASRKRCLFYLYRIASKLYNDLNEQLQRDGLTFKDIMAYMQAIRSFKNSF
ncbi:hypothetical protein [Pseudodesulfovibrio tunisiensis]|uniref:hypothetical protein n=1 Tax=Pseudodesulfovibrio tunisiensis TaxID=463192 RepID=UPI001FB3AFB8|nr:hypothetical protein [Pseudodesulfovibrio tunisiensis]